LHSYPKVWHLGHKNVIELSNSTYYVFEKYDGSQLSFERTREDELVFKSHRVLIDLDVIDKLFVPTIEHLHKKIKSIPIDWIYRGEAFKSNKHNTKKYGRVPKGHLVLFDVETAHHTFLPPDLLEAEANSLEVEPAKLLGTISDGTGMTQAMLDELLANESSLGETKVEGVVFKNYVDQSPWGDPIFAKFVSEEFKESHKQNMDWKQGKDLYYALGNQFASEARWRKSVQRLRDDGQLESSPRDIGNLLRELSVDLLREYGDELKERVWKEAWKRISKAANAGFPEWYKRELAFGHGSDTSVGEEDTRGDSAVAQGDGDDGGRLGQSDRES